MATLHASEAPLYDEPFALPLGAAGRRVFAPPALALEPERGSFTPRRPSRAARRRRVSRVSSPRAEKGAFFLLGRSLVGSQRSSRASGMGAKKAEAELGSFDCVHSESGKAPSVGKLSVFKTSLVFKSQTFGLGEATAIGDDTSSRPQTRPTGPHTVDDLN